MSGRILIFALLAAFVITALTPATVLAASHGSDGERLEWQRDLALWTVVVFVCLVFILAKFAWKPLAEGLDKREQGIADQIAQAEAANQQAKQILADYERQLTGAAEKVRGILDQGRRDAERAGREIVDKAKEEAKAEQQKAVQQIEAAAGAALQQLADQSAAMAVDLAGKIVRTTLNPADHARLIDEAVGGFVSGKTQASRN